MIKTWHFRGFALYLTLGIPLAASCAREANTLDGAGTGGSSTGTAGKASPTAGTLGKPGPSAFGGTASTGGVAAAGGVAGKPAAGGGSGGSGGSGGTTGVPPDVLERASAVVYYETSHATASDKIIQMKLYVENKAADPLPMASVTIRYWFTAEVATTLHQYFTGSQAQMPKAVFVDDGAKHALREGGKSLLPPGIRESEGSFAAGDVVRICDLDGTEFARGIAKFGIAEIKSGQLPRAEVIHRDDLVIL